MEIVVKNLSELRHPEKNLRKHTAKQLAEYIRSVKMFGQTKPILIDESGEIIAGNGLYDALSEIGQKTAECRIMHGLTSSQKKKLMLADNRVYELGYTDTDILGEIICDLDGDIDVPGWDEDLLKMFTATFDDADELIESYGLYKPEEIEALNRKQPPEPASRPEAVVPTPEPTLIPSVSESTTSQDKGDASEENRSVRTIICPHCGGTICL